MKKIVWLVIAAMIIMFLAGCGKDQDSADNGGNTGKVTQHDDNKQKDADNNKKNETTPEPTQKPTDAPVSDPVDDPVDPADDEFYSAGHTYDGVWMGTGCVLHIVPEGAADVITALFEYTDMETFGSWHEYWTNFSEDENAFICPEERFYYFNGDIVVDNIENENRFEIRGEKLYWVNEDMMFEKASDETDNFDPADYFFSGASDPGDTGNRLTDDDALMAVRNYCLLDNPTLQGYVDSGEYNIDWDIFTSEEDQIVVWFRSYTGAFKYFYIDPVSGDTYVTEFVSGIMTEEQMSDETLNAWDYLN